MNPLDELLQNIKDGFKLIPALKVITECDNDFALEHLIPIIQDKINELRIKAWFERQG